MKYFVAGFVSAIVVLFVGVLGYLRLGFAEEQGDIGPSVWESRLMYSAVHASVRRRAPELPNPIQPTEENLIEGGKFYLNNCAGCHGTPGKPSKDYSDSLYPPIPQLPKAGTEYSEAQIFWIAKHGIRRTGMFSSGKWNSDKELWTVAVFIKRIKELPPLVRTALEEKKQSPAN